METLLLLLGLALGGGITWYGARHLEQNKYVSRIKELESKYRYACGEVMGLKEQMVAAKHENEFLQKNLETERSLKAQTAFQWAQSLKKGILIMGVVAFTVGTGLGGAFSWVTATMQTDAKNVLLKAEAELRARIAEDRVQVLNREVDQLKTELSELQRAYYEEQVEKIVVRTKLEILLENLTPRAGSYGFQLNYPKLQTNLRDQLETQLLHELPLIQTAGMKS